MRALIIAAVAVCILAGQVAAAMDEPVPIHIAILIGEAVGEGVDGMQAVGNVIRNRSIRRNIPVERVCRQKWQFSCLNAGEDRLRAFVAKNEAHITDAYTAWQRSGVEDITGSANHYFADWIDPPKWAASMTFTVQRGRHRFYRS